MNCVYYYLLYVIFTWQKIPNQIRNSSFLIFYQRYDFTRNHSPLEIRKEAGNQPALTHHLFIPLFKKTKVYLKFICSHIVVKIILLRSDLWLNFLQYTEIWFVSKWKKKQLSSLNGYKLRVFHPKNYFVQTHAIFILVWR